MECDAVYYKRKKRKSESGSETLTDNDDDDTANDLTTTTHDHSDTYTDGASIPLCAEEEPPFDSDNAGLSDITTDEVNNAAIQRPTATPAQLPQLQPETEDIHTRANLTDEEILQRVPRLRDATNQDVQRLHECKEIDCKRSGSKETQGYCSMHFCQHYRNGQVDIPQPGGLDEAAARGFDVETSSDDNKQPICPFPLQRQTQSGSNDDNGTTAGNREERQKRKATRSERSGSRPPCDEESSGSSGDGGNPKPQKCIGNMCNKTSLRGPLCDECNAILKADKKATKKASKSYPCAFKPCHKRVFVKDTLCQKCNNNLSRVRAEKTPLPVPDETLTLSEKSRVASPQRSRSATLHPPPTRGQEERSPRLGRATLHPAEPQRPERPAAHERRHMDHYPDAMPREHVDMHTRTYRDVHPLEYRDVRPRVPQRQPRRYLDEPHRLQDPRERQYSSRNERRHREVRELQLRNERELQLQRDRDHQLSLRYESDVRNYHHQHRRHEFLQSSDDSESPPSSVISETTNSYSIDDPRYNAEFMNQSSQDPEVRKSEARKPEARKPESRKPEVRKPEVRKPEARKPESRKPDVRKPEVHHARSDRGQCDSGNEYSSVADIPARRRCLNRGCANYGNDKCDGFCNSCYGKLHR